MRTIAINHLLQKSMLDIALISTRKNKNKMESLKQIIEKLEQTRIEKDLSYEDVAKLCDSTRSNIWKVLTNKTIPKADTLFKLIDCLGFDFKTRKKSTIENFVENVNRISEENLKSVETFIPENLVKGEWNENANEIEGKILIDNLKKLTEKKPKAKNKPTIKKLASVPRNTIGGGNYKKEKATKKIEVEKCENCHYETLKSGISILVKKCDNCKIKTKK